MPGHQSLLNVNNSHSLNNFNRSTRTMITYSINAYIQVISLIIVNDLGRYFCYVHNKVFRVN